ncbi:MAG: aspartate--tRNA ligase [Omnitrophica bacterium RIFCSPLOWO2_01_FULL_50_24]|nr:MAG: aspartate--tRNA ligase [Omnitrophica bacterium RIFCSPLOWO2_01_FULL_50_24]
MKPVYRTHTCGELTGKHIGEKVTLAGWIDARRDHGNLIFLDVRDRWGKTQLVFNPDDSRDLHAAAEKLRSEYVVRVEGVVDKRPQGTANPKLSTGEIEVRVSALELLNASKTPPFEILDESDVSEEVRLKYRYLDLRRAPMLKRLGLRHQITQIVRRYFDGHQFIEIETPILTKSTPEGARDFLVPSRLSAGCFYALPQSPQLFKQMLMVAGADRYFQLARCFRDEDFRADRQLEHTQIDVEMSFVTEEDVMSELEGLLIEIMHKVKGIKLQLPLKRLSYQDAMNTYGSDKPDLRFGVELKDVTAILKNTDLKIFQSVIQAKGVIKGLSISGQEFSRSDLDHLVTLVKENGAQGLAWLKVTAEGLESPIAKLITNEQRKELVKTFGTKPGDTLFFVADQWSTCVKALGVLRNRLAERLNLARRDEFKFLWVVDFPLFEWNDEEKRFDSLHHPFTAPKPEDLKYFDSEPLAIHARAYDLVLNGTEIGGGSIRIHQRDVQNQVFRALGISQAEVQEKFGFLLDALAYGAPPHGGIALGLDRLCAILAGVDSIREVIAFPKTQKGVCLMTEAPSKVYPKQLKELSIQVKT